MLPACTSPWNAPQRTVVRKNARITSCTSGAGSYPRSATWATSSIGTPSKNSMVNTLRPDRSTCGSGTAIKRRSNSFWSRRKCMSERASLRRSISSPIWTRNPSSTCNTLPAIWSPVWRTRISRSGCMRSRSVATICSMSGRSTLTATTRPSKSRARCTTAMEAVPTGSGSNSAKASRSDSPRSSSTRWRTSGNGTAGPVSRQARNSSATSSPNIPGDDAMICPNFMKVPPRS